MSAAETELRPLKQGLFSDEVDQVVRLWNVAAAEAYGFYPLTPKTFRTQIIKTQRFQSSNLVLAAQDSNLVGMLHLDVVSEAPYAQAGVIEILAVHPDHRRAGIGRMLLQHGIQQLCNRNAPFIDALGAWPYSPNFAGLVGGSERSGPLASDAAMLGLLQSQGFKRTRESLIMRLDLKRYKADPYAGSSPSQVFLATPRSERRSWLDYVFRTWQLTDHSMTTGDGKPLSRAITARMDNLSNHTGRERYALFGVNTPDPLRKKGYATKHLRHVFSALRHKGAEEVELHVYADNVPALRLYETLGFREVARTVSLRLDLKT